MLSRRSDAWVKFIILPRIHRHPKIIPDLLKKRGTNAGLFAAKEHGRNLPTVVKLRTPCAPQSILRREAGLQNPHNGLDDLLKGNRL